MAEKRPSRLRNLTLVGFTALIPLIAVGMIMGALLVGLWVDGQIGQRGLSTVCLVGVSIPISLVLMTWLTLRLVRTLPPPIVSQVYPVLSHEEEEFFEKK